MLNQSLILVIDGVSVDLGTAQQNPLVRSVLLSLFTWRRANPEDVLPGESRMGWCGDSLASVVGDKFGSRLWLLRRAKLISKTYERAQEYATEALQWMLEDGVAAQIKVSAQRMGIDGLSMNIILYRNDGSPLLDLRFADIWSVVNG